MQYEATSVPTVTCLLITNLAGNDKRERANTKQVQFACAKLVNKGKC